jgi:methanogenic corrinoid protein MtbC1
MSSPSAAPDRRWEQLAEQYTDLLLRRRRADAAALVNDLVADDADIRDIYLHLFQASQTRVGDLWHDKHITVGAEHYCTAATQQIIAGLYQRIFSAVPDGRRMVMACASTELHELGARMVADFLQLEGWDTIYLSANVPTDSIISEVVESDADLLAISVSMPDKVPIVEDIIRRVRTDVARQVPIMVGGGPFNASPDLWRRVGADACGADAADAVRRAEELVAKPSAYRAIRP